MKNLDKALQTIKEGDLVVYPTETAYGLGADALNNAAVEKVYNAKQRPKSKGLTVIVSSLEMAEKYAELSHNEKILIEEFMPGPLTLVADKKDNVPDNLNDKFVFRVSSSPLAQELASEGPIVATSANISGGETSYDVEDISKDLLEKTSFVLDKGRLPAGPTSTIAELRNGEIYIHREGPILQKELEDTLYD